MVTRLVKIIGIGMIAFISANAGANFTANKMCSDTLHDVRNQTVMIAMDMSKLRDGEAKVRNSDEAEEMNELLVRWAFGQYKRIQSACGDATDTELLNLASYYLNFYLVGEVKEMTKKIELYAGNERVTPTIHLPNLWFIKEPGCRIKLDLIKKDTEKYEKEAMDIINRYKSVDPNINLDDLRFELSIEADTRHGNLIYVCTKRGSNDNPPEVDSAANAFRQSMFNYFNAVKTALGN